MKAHYFALSLSICCFHAQTWDTINNLKQIGGYTNEKQNSATKN